MTRRLGRGMEMQFVEQCHTVSVGFNAFTERMRGALFPSDSRVAAMVASDESDPVRPTSVPGSESPRIADRSTWPKFWRSYRGLDFHLPSICRLPSAPSLGLQPAAPWATPLGFEPPAPWATRLDPAALTAALASLADNAGSLPPERGIGRVVSIATGRVGAEPFAIPQDVSRERRIAQKARWIARSKRRAQWRKRRFGPIK